MEFVTNEIAILMNLHKRGLLSHFRDNIVFIIPEDYWKIGNLFFQLELTQYVETEIIKIDSGNIRLSELQKMITQHKLSKYIIADYISICLCQAYDCRLLVSDVALKRLAQQEKVKTISAEVFERILERLTLAERVKK